MYQSLESFLFRTPYFSFSELQDCGSILNDPVFKEMLQVATADLNESIEKGEDKAQFSAYRYYQRACTRPTPFGLFAGCSVGTVSEHTEIQLSKQKDYKRSTRLDMNYICTLIHQIELHKNIREQLHYFPNQSLYPVGNNFRLVEIHYWKMSRAHRISQVELSDYLIILKGRNNPAFFLPWFYFVFFKT